MNLPLPLLLGALFVPAALIIALQFGVMNMVRRLLQQLDAERRRIGLLEQRLADMTPPATAGGGPIAGLPSADVPVADVRVAPGPVAKKPDAPAAVGLDASELRREMLELMRQLVAQGMSVRDIAARCGLSEAEAELMLSLQGRA